MTCSHFLTIGFRGDFSRRHSPPTTCSSRSVWMVVSLIYIPGQCAQRSDFGACQSRRRKEMIAHATRSASQTGASLLVNSLEAQEVKYVFGIPGAKIDK